MFEPVQYSVHLSYDHDADTHWLGHWSWEKEEHAIDRAKAGYYVGQNHAPYFVPENPEYGLLDLAIMEQINNGAIIPICVDVRAMVKGILLAESSLCGIFVENVDEPIVKETVKDLLSDVWGEATKALRSLGSHLLIEKRTFTDEEIEMMIGEHEFQYR